MTELKKPESSSVLLDASRQPNRLHSKILDNIELMDTPGHLLRRAQQRAVELFFQMVGEDGLRPPQLAVMLTIYQQPGLNQSDLVRKTGIDRSTMGDMVARLVKRGFLERLRTSADQRANHLWITQTGVTALENTIEGTQEAQDHIMAPIPAAKRDEFLNLLKLLADLPEDSGNPNKKQGE